MHGQFEDVGVETPESWNPESGSGERSTGPLDRGPWI